MRGSVARQRTVPTIISFTDLFEKVAHKQRGRKLSSLDATSRKAKQSRGGWTATHLRCRKQAVRDGELLKLPARINKSVPLFIFARAFVEAHLLEPKECRAGVQHSGHGKMRRDSS